MREYIQIYMYTYTHMYIYVYEPYHKVLLCDNGRFVYRYLGVASCGMSSDN